jgi:hypothetical protein
VGFGKGCERPSMLVRHRDRVGHFAPPLPLSMIDPVGAC